MIPTLWRLFGKAILKERHCSTSVCVPAAHAWVGTANTLEYVVSGKEWQVMTQGRSLLAEHTGPVRSGMNAFERVVQKCNVG